MSKSFELRNVDDFYAFFTCCVHLKDWLKTDPSLDASIGIEAERLIESITGLQVCADVANGSKHHVIDGRVRYSPKKPARMPSPLSGTG